MHHMEKSHTFLQEVFVLYSLRLTLFVMFEKLNFLREHYLLSCLSFKIV